MASGLGKKRAILSEINITPLLDVTFTVLVIFMIVAPSIQQGVPVELPQATLAPLDSKETQVVVTVTAKNEIHISYLETTYKVDLKNLQARLNKIFGKNPERELYLRADKNVPYGTVMKTMATIKAAGIDKIGMVTELED